MEQIILTVIPYLPAILTGIAGVIAAAAAFVSALRNAKKLDENTALTKLAAAHADTASTKAENAVVVAKDSAKTIATALNGLLDEKVRAAKKEGYNEGYTAAKNDLAAPGSPLKDEGPKLA